MSQALVIRIPKRGGKATREGRELRNDRAKVRRFERNHNKKLTDRDR
jgi:hypothetical protein